MGINKNRVFDKSQLNQLVAKTQVLMDTADTIVGEIYSELCRIETTLGKLPADVRDTKLQENVGVLKREIKTNDFKEHRDKITKSINLLEQNVCKGDKDLSTKINVVTVTMNTVVARLQGLTEFIPNGADAGRYEDFEKEFEKCSKVWDTINNAVKTILGKILASLKGGKNEAVCFSCDPVNLSTGNFIYTKTDLKIKGKPEISMTRFYNEMDRQSGVFGRGWRHPYEISLYKERDEYTVILADGKEESFLRKNDGSYFGEKTNSHLKENEDGYTYTTKLGETVSFNKTGQYIGWEDANGNRLTLSYKDGRLERLDRNQDNAYLVFTYDKNGKLEKVTDHEGRSVSYEYEQDRLYKVVGGTGENVQYTYNEDGRLEAVTNTEGTITVKNTYDGEGRTIKQEFPDGGTMSYEYDDVGKKVVMTERNGSQSSYYHDDNYRNVRTVYEDGEESFAYNRKGQCIRHTDCNGNITRFSYDIYGNMTQKIDELGTKSNATYDKNNRLLKLSVNGKQQLKNCYDKRGNLISSTDSLGRTTTFLYGENGSLEQITRPDGGTVALSYDKGGNITKVIDPYGSQTNYQYDSLNRIIAMIDPIGGKTSYGYDNKNNLVKLVNALGQTKEYQYNSLGKQIVARQYDGTEIKTEYNALNRPCAITNALGKSIKYSYDSMWNVSEIQLPNGGKQRYEYDKRNRLSRVIDPMGNKMEYEYDANGNKIIKRNAKGQEIKYTYTKKNQVESITNPEGQCTRFEYNEQGLLAKQTDACGNVSYYAYDTAGQKISETDALGRRISYTYTPLGEVESVTSPNGLITKYEYESGGRLKRINYPDQTNEIFTYDANGNIETYTNRTGQKNRYEYDLLNRITKTVGSDGEEKEYTYGLNGKIATVLENGKVIKKYEYSPIGELLQVTDAIGNTIEYEYDAMGALEKMHQCGEHSVGTLYKRNLNGQVEAIVDSLGNEEQYEYDVTGHLVKKKDKDGYVTNYSYTPCGELSGIDYDEKQHVNFAYDPLQKLIEVEDWIGTTKFVRNAVGQIQKVQYPDGKEVQYTYGEDGERRSLTYPDGKTVHYDYNDYMQLSNVRDGQNSIEYSYDLLGRLSNKQYSNGTQSSYEYNENGRLKNIWHQDQLGLIDSFQYSYDEHGNKTSVQKQRRDLPEESGCWKYSYDPLGRISLVTKEGEILRSYKYDLRGNRIAKEEAGKKTIYGYNDLNQMICQTVLQDSEEKSYEYQYDKRGNMTSVIENGTEKSSYQYGPLNRLEKVVNATGETVDYVYNGLGYRTGKPNQNIQYYIDVTKNSHNVLEKVENGTVQSYLVDGGLTGLEENGKYSYVVTDDLGSPARLIDEQGKITESYGYTEFGEAIYPDQKHTQPFGFTGYEYDAAANTYFAQAREYMPEAGRFAAKDKNRYIRKGEPATLNQYNYCLSNPLKWTDPMGFDLKDSYNPSYGKNDPVKVSVDGNNVTLDVYVDIQGDIDDVIEDTSVEDLVTQGIENWGGEYKDVYGNDTTVTVNVHKGHKSWWSWLPWVSSQNYIDVNLHSGAGRAYASHSVPWDRSDPGEMNMYTALSGGDARQAYDYRNTITHEFGHLFGIDDGYPDDNYASDNTLRPGASMLEDNDIMVNNHATDAHVSPIDIQMLLAAAASGEWQYFMDYKGNHQSDGAKEYGGCMNE